MSKHAISFGTSYAECRERFRTAAAARSLPVTSIRHPHLDADVTVDAVTLGGPDAANLRVVIAGAHGVELPFGSAVQTDWLAGGGEAPADTAVLLVHAINCAGAFQRRRNTDGNIDLCRNFRDGGELPRNPAYERLAADLNAPPGDAAADANLAAARTEMGQTFIHAIMGGQFIDPTGFSYGGLAPTWSRRTLESLLLSHAGASDVVILDLHTGVGPFAEPTFVCLQEGSALAAARRRFGDDLLAPMEQAPGRVLHPAVGHPTEGYERLFPAAAVVSVVLEMGTCPPDETLPVLIEEHRLTRAGLADTGAGQAMRTTMWEQHAPVDDRWREAVLRHGRAAMQALIRGTC
ncbi:MAG: DUF2817 domain-containing protein [Pseudomonadales bacterium]